MKIKTALYLLIIFTLVACTPSSASTAQEPTAPPTETATKPTPAPTKAPTQTPTEVPIPDYMDEFIAKGYDQQLISGDSMYVVVHETEVRIGPNGGWVVNLPNVEQVHILSVLPVSYIENGQMQRRLMVDQIAREVSGSYYTYMTRSTSLVIDPLIISPATVEGMSDGFANFTEGDYAIFKASNDVKPESGIGEIFEGLFPPQSEQPQIINIPGVGDILAFIALRTPTP